MLKPKVPKTIEYIINKLLEAGFQAGLVGGSLRNMLLNIPVKDYDLATSASTKEIKALFYQEKILDHGLKYGTLTLLIDGESIEVTTFRKETGYLDHRHPDQVEFISDLKTDLSRRDFTINSLFYNQNTGLTDYFNGLADLRNKMIRCVGNSEERFEEDPLRILRALRFASQLGFEIEEETEKGIQTKYPLLVHISKERIANELVGIFSGNDYLKILDNYYQLLYFLIPELNKKPVDNTYYQQLHLRLAAFFLNLQEGFSFKDLLKQLPLNVSQELNKHDLKQIIILLEHKNFPLTKDHVSQIRLWQSLGWNKELYQMWIQLFYPDKSLPLKELPSYEFKDLKITGKELLEAGYQPDQIKETLNYLFLQVATGNLENIYVKLQDHIKGKL